MHKAAFSAFVIVLLAIEVVRRTWVAPDAWWNLAAVALVVGGLIGAGFTWRDRANKSKASWYTFRPFGLCVASILLLVIWLVFRLPAPMGSGPAGPEVDAAAFEHSWSNRNIILMSMGDSVSTGYGAPPGHGYFGLIRKNANATYPEMAGVELQAVLPNIEVLRRATNSSNSIAHLRTIRNLPVYSEDRFGIVCMTTGGIDLIHAYGKSDPVEGAMYGASVSQANPWISNFRTRLDDMMLTLTSKFPGGCIVMLATIYEPTDTVGDIENAGPMFWMPAWPDGKEIHAAFNDALRDCAQRHPHVYLVDMYEVMLGHGIHCRDRDNPHYDADDPSYWFYINLEDPNRRGYDAIRRVFLNAITVALREQPGFDVPPALGQ